MDQTIAIRLAISLILGMIIGLERGWSSRELPQGLGSGGLRNFALLSLLGSIAALLAQRWGLTILSVIFLGLCALITTAYVITSKQSQDYGTTTEIAMLITFILGALVQSGLEIEAVAVAVITTWLLELKQEVHHYLELLKRQELVATLKLLLIAVVALPLLPNDHIGPWQAINPRSLGLLVLLIAAVSYIGYFAVRILGNRFGLLLTGLLGGLASSTAVTISFSRMAKRGQGVISLLAVGIALASATMAPRLLIIIAVVNAAVAAKLMIPLSILGLVPLIIAIIIMRRVPQPKSGVSLEMNNPVELGIALQYAVLLAVLSVLVHAAQNWFGNGGVYVISAISGLADVDAVSISLAQAVNGTIGVKVATIGILIAVAVNTLVKVVLARIIGGIELMRWCGAILVSALVVSFFGVLLVGF